MTTDTRTRPVAPQEVQQADAAANSLRHALLNSGIQMPLDMIGRVWVHFQSRMKATDPTDFAVRLKVAQQAQAAMQAFAQMNMRDLAVLNERDTMQARTGYQQSLVDAADAVIAAYPLLAEIFAAIAEEDVARNARAEASEAIKRKLAEEAAPGDILAALKAQGIGLDVDDSGNITAPRGAQIGPAWVQRITRFKPELVALIHAEAVAAAEAAKPVVIA